MIRRARGMSILVAAGVIWIFLAGPVAADWGRSEIQIFCYEGDRSNEEYLGTVDVFSLSNPAGNCNVMYADCNGNCTACYDDESAREVYVGSSGVPYYY